MKLASVESFSFDNLKSKIQNQKSRAPVYIPTVIAILAVLTCLLPLIADAQTTSPRDQSWLPPGRFFQLLLGCVPLGFV
jgi:hypothetical protein